MVLFSSFLKKNHMNILYIDILNKESQQTVWYEYPLVNVHITMERSTIF